MSHTPEPWASTDQFRSEGASLFVATMARTGNEKRVICRIHNEVSGRPLEDEDYANARRIVACVNACEGSSTEWLEFQASADRVEQFGPPEPFETRYTKELQKGIQYMEQRDELLQALQDLLVLYQRKRPGMWGASLDQVKAANAAIQKATGVA